MINRYSGSLLLVLILLGACGGSTTQGALCSDLEEVKREWFDEANGGGFDRPAFDALEDLASSAKSYDQDSAVVAAGDQLDQLYDSDAFISSVDGRDVDRVIGPIEAACNRPAAAPDVASVDRGPEFLVRFGEQVAAAVNARDEAALRELATDEVASRLLQAYPDGGVEVTSCEGSNAGATCGLFADGLFFSMEFATSQGNSSAYALREGNQENSDGSGGGM